MAVGYGTRGGIVEFGEFGVGYLRDEFEWGAGCVAGGEGVVSVRVYDDGIRFGGVYGGRILADGVFEGVSEIPCIADVDGQCGVNVRYRNYDRVIPLIHSLRVPGCFIAEFNSSYSF